MLDLSKKQHTLNFKNRFFSTEEMEQIGQHNSLVGIVFKDCPITDEDIKKISHLPKLVNLTIEGAAITDLAFEYLSGLPKLELLFMDRNAITGEGLKYFENHKKLNCLWVCDTLFNDKGLEYAAKIPKLGTLRIDTTKVSFDGLMAIASNPKINVIGKKLFTEEQILLFEAEQRKLAKKKNSMHPDDQKNAKKVLLSFFDAITDWEKYATELLEKNLPLFTDEMDEKCMAIYRTYCTDKVIQQGARRSFFGPPNYSYAGENIVDTEQSSKNKILFYTKNQIDFQYRYTLLKKGTEWKVDTRQQQDTGWKKTYL